MSDTLVCVHGFRMLLKFRTFSQKYKIYEIKSRTKFSAITVSHQSANRTHTRARARAPTHSQTSCLPVYSYVMNLMTIDSEDFGHTLLCIFKPNNPFFFVCVYVCVYFHHCSDKNLSNNCNLFLRLPLGSLS